MSEQKPNVDWYGLCILGCTLVGSVVGVAHSFTRQRNRIRTDQCVVVQVAEAVVEESQMLLEGYIIGTAAGFIVGMTAPVTLPIALVRCLVA